MPRAVSFKSLPEACAVIKEMQGSGLPMGRGVPRRRARRAGRDPGGADGPARGSAPGGDGRARDGRAPQRRLQPLAVERAGADRALGAQDPPFQPTSGARRFPEVRRRTRPMGVFADRNSVDKNPLRRLHIRKPKPGRQRPFPADTKLVTLPTIQLDSKGQCACREGAAVTSRCRGPHHAKRKRCFNERPQITPPEYRQTAPERRLGTSPAPNP